MTRLRNFWLCPGGDLQAFRKCFCCRTPTAATDSAEDIDPWPPQEPSPGKDTPVTPLWASTGVLRAHIPCHTALNCSAGSLHRGRSISAAETSISHPVHPRTQPSPRAHMAAPQHRLHLNCSFPKHSAKFHPFLWDCQPISWIINSSKASRCFSIWACFLPFVLSPVLPYINQSQTQLPPVRSFTKISRWNMFSH